MRGTLVGAVVLAVVVSLVTPAGAVPGAVVWTKRLNGPGYSRDMANGVAASPDGTKVFVTGSRDAGSSTSTNFLTVAYNATGGIVWSKQYNGPGHAYDSASDVAVSPDGSRVYVGGVSVNAAGNQDFATVAYNATTGAVLWTRRYDGPGHGYDEFSALAVSPDGTTVVVTGESAGATGNQDFATVAYNAANGAQRWARRYDGPGHNIDHPYAIAVSPDATKVFVVGFTPGGPGGIEAYDYATVAYAATTGARAWVKRYDGGANKFDAASSVAVSPDSTRVFVSGTSIGPTTGNDVAIVAYDTSAGGVAWAARNTGTSAASNDNSFKRSLAVSPDGTRVFVTGYGTTTLNGTDYSTRAYNAASGSVAWTARYDGPGHRGDNPTAIAVSPDGTRVAVTGVSEGANLISDYATVVYRVTTGGVIWSKRYNGPANMGDYPSAVAVTATRVFVTGTSDSRATPSDFATLAYRLT